MARKQALPAEQLDRLNDRCRRERDALVALTNARLGVEQALRHLDVASGALKDARRCEHLAYQQVVALVGSTAATELAGGAPNGKVFQGCRPSRPPKKRATSAAASAAKREADGDQGGEVTEN